LSERLPFALPGARPHYGPDRAVRVEHLDLHLRPEFATKTLHGEVTTRVRAIEGGVRTLRLDAVDLTIDAVRDGRGATLAFTATSKHLTIELPAALAADEVFSFAVAYRAIEPRRGLYFIDRPRQAWTQSQDTDARAWVPCFDHPSEKATTTTTIVVEPGHFALGNGALTSRTESADGVTFRYEQAIPHATYLLTMVAGMFSEIEQARTPLPIAYYVEPGREADGERSFGRTPDMIETFESALGVPYPYARYSQIAVADFIFGGMENTSATTQTDRTLHDERAHLDFSSEPLVAHELAHQWFGDLVTCRDWSQAWLNEGFATYFETVWMEASRGWDEYQRDVFEIVGRYLDEDGERYSRPIVCNVYRDPIELFDRHLYEKGAAVLHMLRGELGWERMKRALRTYIDENATRSVETIDLVRAIEHSTGRNVREFFAQWIDRAGHPELEIRASWDGERSALTLEVEQKQAIDENHAPYIFDLDLGMLAAQPHGVARDAGDGPVAGEQRVRVHVERALESFVIAAAAKPALIRIDPGAYLLCAMTYALGTEWHAAVLRGDPSPVARIRAARALGKDDARSAHEALAAALRDEPFWGVSVEIATVLGRARSAYARDALLEALAHPHPKVRRAVADALGTYREADVASALLNRRSDESYFVVAAALTALGKTRDPRAFDALAAALGERSWNETIAAGAVRGLAELGDARALEPLVAATRADRAEPLRRAAVGALARLGTLVDTVRTAAADALERALEDPSYLVRLSTYAATETLADARLLPALDRLATAESDGRLRRDAAEAAMRIRSAAKTPPELVRLREEVDRLRDDLNRLRDRDRPATPML
jgi:aminopeptidase N